METLVPWLARFVHVAAAALWVGGFGALALVIIPALRRSPSPALFEIASGVVRVLSFCSIATILAGFILIEATRGFMALFRGEWGGIVLVSMIASVAIAGLADGGVGPNLRRGAEEPSRLQRAQRFATIALVLSLLTIAVMTRAIYARG